MKTATDYWLENLSLKVATAYVAGDMVTVHKADDRFSSNDHEHVFDIYRRQGSHKNFPVSFTRLSRHATEGSFFLLPPSLARDIHDGRLDVDALAAMREPSVARVDMERLPAGGLIKTYVDPFTKKTKSSGSIDLTALPWLSPEWATAQLITGSIRDLSNAAQMDLAKLTSGYWQALMLRYFTFDLDYPLPLLLDLAGTQLDFQAKLDLLRGEFSTYSAQGIPPSLFAQLLPMK